ncbi:UNVERIFIED_ORG: hypothetical protein EDC92_13810 [Dietzia maris]
MRDARPGGSDPRVSTSSRKRIARLEVGALCAVLVLLVVVAGLARMGGEGAQASPSHAPPAGQAVAMKAAADLTPWTFTIDEAYAYGERACADIRNPHYDGFGGFYMGVRKTWVAVRLDAHGLSSEEQVEHHRRLYAEAARSLCPELLPQVPLLYR